MARRRGRMTEDDFALFRLRKEARKHQVGRLITW
jgi:hypothetical protein